MEFETGHTLPEETESQEPIIDMEPYLQRVPPIDGVFSPDEEVQKLWSVPKDQRRETVDIFKANLSRQREAWALCRTSIEEWIEANPGLSREKMAEIISVFASHYGFAEQHIKVAESLIDDYVEMHERVTEIRRKFPDDIALINNLTKLKFTKVNAEDFDISVGPMSIDISCSGSNAGRIYENLEGSVGEFKSGGFVAKSNNKRRPIYYVVINKDKAHDPNRHEIVPHEHEHVKNRLLIPNSNSESEIRTDVLQALNRDRGIVGFFRHKIAQRVFGIERDFLGELYQKYVFSGDPEQKKFFLEEYMKLSRELAFNRAKNEIVALYKGGRHLTGGSRDYTFFSESSHDYLSYLRDWEQKKDDPLWQETAQRILVDEYKQIIKGAVDSFNRLLDGGYTREEAIAMMTDKCLAMWPKTVRRLLEQRQKNK